MSVFPRVWIWDHTSRSWKRGWRRAWRGVDRGHPFYIGHHGPYGVIIGQEAA